MVEPRKSSEALEQGTFMEYMRLKKVFAYATINENIWSGIIRYQIKPASRAIRIIATIERNMKKLGKKKGVPDVFIPYMSKGYGGMYIEFKYGKNKQTKEQAEVMKILRDRGYFCDVCYSANEAIELFEQYRAKG